MLGETRTGDMFQRNEGPSPRTILLLQPAPRSIEVLYRYRIGLSLRFPVFVVVDRLSRETSPHPIGQRSSRRES